MSIATDLRAMRDYIAEHGFSPHLDTESGARCFIGSVRALEWNGSLFDYLREFVGYDLSARGLQDWSTDDAIAAIDIAWACAVTERK